jgi:transposase
MSRYDLTDFEWRVIEPLLRNKPRGVPRVDDRRVLNGIFSKRLYRERNLIERFFSKLKHFRRVATHYAKLAANFLAMVQLASMRLWLRAYESTA